jgi:hypothetical protein
MELDRIAEACEPGERIPLRTACDADPIWRGSPALLCTANEVEHQAGDSAMVGAVDVEDLRIGLTPR